MAIFDIQGHTVTLKIVYYGPALGGKTTNLETLHRLTDPEGAHEMVSIATQDDRTLFFDLMPMDLGQIGGMAVKVKVYTVPGQLHYERTRRQVLAGTDGVVAVMDSTPGAEKSNAWALENLRVNLKANGLDPDETPLVLQWNKRDLPDARPVDLLEKALNPRRLPCFEAVATEGPGVVDTFAAALKETLWRAYQKAGRKSVKREQVEQLVDGVLTDARARQVPAEDQARKFVHRVDMEAYQEEEAAKSGRQRMVMDQESLLGEAVLSGMKLAEKLDQYKDVHGSSETRGRMVEALAKLSKAVTPPAQDALPAGTMKMLLEGANRTRGSLLLSRPNEKMMTEREVLPRSPDVLNYTVNAGIGSLAYTVSRREKPYLIQDLASELFFDTVPPGAESLVSAYVAPLIWDGLEFGVMLVYAEASERPIEPLEQFYWQSASTLLGVSLHWRALKRKLERMEKAS